MAKTVKASTVSSEQNEKRKRRNRLKLRKEMKQTVKDSKRTSQFGDGKSLSIGKVARELKRTQKAEEGRDAAKQVLEMLLSKRAK